MAEPHVLVDIGASNMGRQAAMTKRQLILQEERSEEDSETDTMAPYVDCFHGFQKRRGH